MNCIRSRSILLFFRRLILLCWFWFYFCFWCENNLLFYFIKIKIKFTPEHTQLYGEWLNEKKAQKERKKTLHFFLLFGSRAIIDFWSTVWWFCVFLFYFFSLSRSLFLLLLLFVVIYYGCCCSLFWRYYHFHWYYKFIIIFLLVFSLAGFGFPKHDFSSPMAKKTESRHFSLSATLLCCLLLAAAAAVGPYVKVYSIAIILFSLYFDWKYVHTKSCMEYGLVRTAYTHAFPCRICSKMWKEKKISAYLRYYHIHQRTPATTVCLRVCAKRDGNNDQMKHSMYSPSAQAHVFVYILFI